MSNVPYIPELQALVHAYCGSPVNYITFAKFLREIANELEKEN